MVPCVGEIRLKAVKRPPRARNIPSKSIRRSGDNFKKTDREGRVDPRGFVVFRVVEEVLLEVFAAGLLFRVRVVVLVDLDFLAGI